jgi:hypothetical protein
VLEFRKFILPFLDHGIQTFDVLWGNDCATTAAVPLTLDLKKTLAILDLLSVTNAFLLGKFL